MRSRVEMSPLGGGAARGSAGPHRPVNGRKLGETDPADAVEAAVREIVAAGETTTYDPGGSAGTREFGEAVAARV
jgi:hypothetical protein